MKRLHAVLLSLALSSPAAFAAPVTVSDQQAITTSGQTFNFSFTGLATAGTGGQLNVTLNGDYSGINLESALASLDVVGGSVDLGAGVNGVISNTISGLTLASYSRTVYASDDVQLSYVFNISDALLGTMLADGKLTARVVNDTAVNPYNWANPDFVRLGFSFNSTQGNAVPEPGSLALAGLALAGLGLSRRRARK